MVDDVALEHGPRRPWLGPHRPLLHRLAQPVIDILRVEAAGGVALVVAALAALLWANSPWQQSYHDLWHTQVSLDVGAFRLEEDLRHWIDEGLMAMFFFVVGLEIKSELVTGELNGARHAMLPAAAALGGMVVPALVYFAFNVRGGAPEGWGIPVATDIAFALGVVALLGRAVPQTLKVFLLALAIVDDIGAILVIAVFYTSSMSLGWLLTAAALVAVIVLMRWIRIWYVPAYVVVGMALWLATYKSGVHATVAGVVLGILAPARPLLSRLQVERLTGAGAAGPAEATEDNGIEPGEMAFLVRETVPVTDRLREMLHPWTSYAVLPLFALANAGVTFSRDMLGAAVSSPVALGVSAGLVVGKPVGVLGGVWLATRLGLARLPAKVSWPQLAGVATIAGIGFTMSLFIAGLAFTAGDRFEQAQLGIYVASILAAGIGVWILRAARAPDGQG